MCLAQDNKFVEADFNTSVNNIIMILDRECIKQAESDTDYVLVEIHIPIYLPSI